MMPPIPKPVRDRKLRLDTSILPAAFALNLLLAAPARAQFTWDGSCGNDNWHSCCNIGQLVDNNWDLDPEPQCPPFPGPNDDVDLNGAIARISTRLVEIRNVFNGTLIVQSFGLRAAGNVEVESLQLSSDLVVGGIVNILGGPFIWRGGRLAGPQGNPARAGGPITLDGIVNVNLDGLSLVSEKPVSWTGSGGLQLNSGAEFRNNASFSMTNSRTISGNNGRFINNGPFSKTESTDTTLILAPVFFDNASNGSINVATGRLSIQGSGSSRGAINVNSGAILSFATSPAETFTVEEDTTVTGSGLVQFGPASGPFVVAAGKTFTADNAEIITTPGVNGPGTYEFSNLRFERGTLGGAGTTNVNGPCVIVGNLPKTINSHTFNLRGATTWNGTNFVELQLFDAGVLNNFGQFTVASEPNKRVRYINGQWVNHPGSTMDILSNLQFIVGPGVFRNQGTLTINADASTVDVSAADFEQLGTLNVVSGALSVGSGRAAAARFNLSPGALLNLVVRTFTTEADTQFTGEGIVHIGLNGTLDVQAATTIPRVELTGGAFGGTVRGPGTLTVSSNLLWSGGRMLGPDTGQTIIAGELDVSASVRIEERTVSTRGAVTLDVPATISLAQDALFIVSPGSTLTAERQAGQQSNVFTGLDNSAILVRNEGEIRIRGNGPDSAGNFASIPLVNLNLVDVQNVQVTAVRGGSSTGTFSIGEGATMTFGGGYQWNAGTRLVGSGLARIGNFPGVAVSGDVEAENIEHAGTVSGPGSLRVASNLMLRGGRVENGGRLVNLGTGEGSGGPTQLTLTDSIFENQGNVRFSADLVMNGASLLINRGDFRLSGGGDISGPGTSAVQNFGIFRTVSPTIRVPFSNLGGVVTHEGGILRFTGPYNQTSAGRLVNERGSGTIVFDQPPALSRGTRIEGQGVFRVAGQFRSPASIAPGASAGRMTIEAQYIQEPDGVLEIEIAGRTPETEYDVLEIIGDATLAGTLDVRLIDGFQPAKGDRFTILTCTSRTGEFDTLILPTSPTAKGANWRVEYFADHVDLVFDG